MSTPNLVQAFYDRIWNAGELTAADELLARDFSFRGSLGEEMRGRDAFRNYVRSIRLALDGYRCEILDCVSEGDRAFAKMRFSGMHVGPFRRFAPTGKRVSWDGAALFRFLDDRVTELWVLGDLAGLDALLEQNRSTTS
jgi:predicted ester cyclase